MKKKGKGNKVRRKKTHEVAKKKQSTLVHQKEEYNNKLATKRRYKTSLTYRA